MSTSTESLLPSPVVSENAHKIAEWREHNPTDILMPNQIEEIIGEPLPGADLRGSVLLRTDLSDTDLTEIDLSYSDLRGCSFDRARLYRALMCAVTLSGNSLRETECVEVSFAEANLTDVKAEKVLFDHAFMGGADMSDSVLVECDFTGAVIPKTAIEDASIVSKCDFEEAVIMPTPKKSPRAEGTDAR